LLTGGEARNAGRKKIEAILSPAQLEAYKKRQYSVTVWEMLSTPDCFARFGVAREQLDKLRQLGHEVERRSEQRSEQQKDAFLPLLRPRQREALRAEVERRYWEDVGLAEERTTTLPGGDMVIQRTVTLNGTTDYVGRSYGDSMFVPVYGWLSSQAVRKQLRMSAAQEKQLTTVASKWRTENESLTQKAQKSPPIDFQKSYRTLVQDVRKRIEELLTPQQLAGLKEIVFRETVAGVLTDPFEQEKIGLSERQKDAVKKAHWAGQQRSASDARDMYDKVMAILTREQQDKVREEAGRDLW